jgi:thiamine pyridinylase
MGFISCCIRASAVAVFLLFVSLFSPPVLLAADKERDCLVTAPDQPIIPITLRVALYPYTPDRLALFHKIESVFECENPGANVVLVSTRNATDKYYSDDDAKKEGFRFVDADVYEIDTILLSDFVAMGKIAPLELPFQDFVAEAIEAVTRNGQVYGAPRWLCGNFLFYRRSDIEIRDARTWQALRTILAKRNQGMFVDFKGKSTLGEWYLTALSSLVGVEAAQRQIVDDAPVNGDAVSFLQQILSTCPLGFCRSDRLHNNVGYYSRAFVRGQAAAFIGYSEAIHYGLREASDDCLSTSGCLSETDIAVRALPSMSDTRPEPGIGWVDSLAIDASLSGRKKDMALKFIQRALSDDVYLSILSPEWPYRSRYLLPARRGVQVPDAPLYLSFLAAHNGRRTGTLPGLNKRLRAVAQSFDCQLPVDRDDSDTSTACQRR